MMRSITVGGAVGLVLALSLGGWVALRARPAHHDWRAVSVCLDSNPSTTGMSSDVDYLAASAPHAAATDVQGDHATIVDGGNSFAQQYRAAGAASVEEDGNIVVAWDEPPTDEQRAIMDGCLQ